MWNKALLYLTSVFSYNLDFTSGATRPCKILNFVLLKFLLHQNIEHTSQSYISRVVGSLAGPNTEGGRAAGAVAPPPPQRKLNLQFLFYFKYIGQDKSCLIFKYIGALNSFAPLAKKSCVWPCSLVNRNM